MKRISKVINFILVVIMMLLSYKIFINKSVDNIYLQNLFSKLTNHISLNSKDINVSSINYFNNIKDNQYSNELYSVYPPRNSIVIEVDQESIILKCDNNFYACFYNLVNVNVDKMDVVDKEDCLANFIDYYIFYFYKDNKVYNYEQVM